jgi:hypothetical protein
MAAGGLAIGGDLAGWLRPLTYAVFALVLVSLVLVLFGSGASAFLSLAIGGLSRYSSRSTSTTSAGTEPTTTSSSPRLGSSSRS